MRKGVCADDASEAGLLEEETIKRVQIGVAKHVLHGKVHVMLSGQVFHENYMPSEWQYKVLDPIFV